MHKFALAALAAVALAAPASAAVLTIDTGWQDDTLNDAGSPTAGSPWTITLTRGAHFSLVDCCITGDVYTLSGDIAGVSSFFAGPSDKRAEGFYGSFWTSAAYSKYTTWLSAGTYTFSVTGDGVGGLPAGLGLRLDSAVPEPATWAMLILGFGLVGASVRRRAVRSVQA